MSGRTKLEWEFSNFPIIVNQLALFKHRFAKEQLKKAGLNERQVKAVEYVKKNGKITNSDYQKLCEVSERTALRDLDELSTKGILEKER